MSITEERVPDTKTVEPDRSSQSNRGLIAVIAVLALALVGLGAWVIYDQTSGSDEAADPQLETVTELVDTMHEGLNERDLEKFTSVFTEDAVWVANASGASVTRLDLDAGETATTKVGGTPRDVVEAVDRICEPFYSTKTVDRRRDNSTRPAPLISNASAAMKSSPKLAPVNGRVGGGSSGSGSSPSSGEETAPSSSENIIP